MKKYAMPVTRQNKAEKEQTATVTGVWQAEPNKHQIKTEQTRRKLLKSALKVFVKQGFQVASLEDIAKDAGYTRGAFYAHFDSKEDLFLALLENQFCQNLQQLEGLVDAAGSPREKLNVLREYYVSRINDQNWAMLMLEFKLFASRHPKLHGSLAARHRAMRNSFKKQFLLSVLQEQQIAPALEQEAIRGMLEAVLHGFVLQRAYDPQMFSQEEAVDALRVIFDRLTGPA